MEVNACALQASIVELPLSISINGLEKYIKTKKIS